MDEYDPFEDLDFPADNAYADDEDAWMPEDIVDPRSRNQFSDITRNQPNRFNLSSDGDNIAIRNVGSMLSESLNRYPGPGGISPLFPIMNNQSNQQQQQQTFGFGSRITRPTGFGFNRTSNDGLYSSDSNNRFGGTALTTNSLNEQMIDSGMKYYDRDSRLSDQQFINSRQNVMFTKPSPDLDLSARQSVTQDQGIRPLMNFSSSSNQASVSVGQPRMNINSWNNGQMSSTGMLPERNASSGIQSQQLGQSSNARDGRYNEQNSFVRPVFPGSTIQPFTGSVKQTDSFNSTLGSTSLQSASALGLIQPRSSSTTSCRFPPVRPTFPFEMMNQSCYGNVPSRPSCGYQSLGGATADKSFKIGQELREEEPIFGRPNVPRPINPMSYGGQSYRPNTPALMGFDSSVSTEVSLVSPLRGSTAIGGLIHGVPALGFTSRPSIYGSASLDVTRIQGPSGYSPISGTAPIAPVRPSFVPPLQEFSGTYPDAIRPSVSVPQQPLSELIPTSSSITPNVPLPGVSESMPVSSSSSVIVSMPVQSGPAVSCSGSLVGVMVPGLFKGIPALTRPFFGVPTPPGLPGSISVTGEAPRVSYPKFSISRRPWSSGKIPPAVSLPKSGEISPKLTVGNVSTGALSLGSSTIASTSSDLVVSVSTTNVLPDSLYSPDIPIPITEISVPIAGIPMPEPSLPMPKQAIVAEPTPLHDNNGSNNRSTSIEMSTKRLINDDKISVGESDLLSGESSDYGKKGDSAKSTEKKMDSVSAEGGQMFSDILLTISRKTDADCLADLEQLQSVIKSKTAARVAAGVGLVAALPSTTDDVLIILPEREHNNPQSNEIEVKICKEPLDASESNTSADVLQDETETKDKISSISNIVGCDQSVENMDHLVKSMISVPDVQTLDIPLPPPIPLPTAASANLDAASSSDVVFKSTENADVVIREMYLGPSVEYLVDLTAIDAPSPTCNVSSVDDVSLEEPDVSSSAPEVYNSNDKDIDKDEESEDEDDEDDVELPTTQSISSWEIRGVEPPSVKASSAAEVPFVSRKDSATEDDASGALEQSPSWKLLRISKEMSREEETFVRSKSEQLKTMKQRLAEELRLEDQCVKNWESSFDIPAATQEKSETNKGVVMEKSGEKNSEKTAVEKKSARSIFENVSSGTVSKSGSQRASPVIKFKPIQTDSDGKILSTSQENTSNIADIISTKDDTIAAKDIIATATDKSENNDAKDKSINVDATEKIQSDVSEKLRKLKERSSNEPLSEMRKESDGGEPRGMEEERRSRGKGEDRDASGKGEERHSRGKGDEEDELSRRLLSLSRELELIDQQRAASRERNRAKNYQESRRKSGRTTYGDSERKERHVSREENRKRSHTPEKRSVKLIRKNKDDETGHKRGRSEEAASRGRQSGEDGDRHRKKHRSRSKSQNIEDAESRSKHEPAKDDSRRKRISHERAGVSESRNDKRKSEQRRRSSQGRESSPQRRNEYREEYSSLKQTRKSRERHSEKPKELFAEEDLRRRNHRSERSGDKYYTDDYVRSRREDYYPSGDGEEVEYHRRREEDSGSKNRRRGEKIDSSVAIDRRETVYDLRQELEAHRRTRKEIELETSSKHRRVRHESESEMTTDHHGRVTHDSSSRSTNHKCARHDSVSEMTSEHLRSLHEPSDVPSRYRHGHDDLEYDGRHVTESDVTRHRRKGHETEMGDTVQEHRSRHDPSSHKTRHRRDRVRDESLTEHRARRHDSDSEVAQSSHRSTRHGSLTDATSELRRVRLNVSTSSQRRNKDAGEERASGGERTAHRSRHAGNGDPDEERSGAEKRKRRRSLSGAPGVVAEVPSRVRRSKSPHVHSSATSVIAAIQSSSSSRKKTRETVVKPSNATKPSSRRRKKPVEFFGQLSRKDREVVLVSGGAALQSTDKDRSPEDVVWIDDTWDSQRQSLIEFQERTSTLLGACLNTRKELENEYERRHASKRKQRREEKRKERRKARRAEIAAMNANGVVCDLVSDSNDDDVLALDDFDATQDVIFTSTSPANAAADSGRRRKSKRDQTKKKTKARSSKRAAADEGNQDVATLAVDSRETLLAPSTSDVIIALHDGSDPAPKIKKRKKSDKKTVEDGQTTKKKEKSVTQVQRRSDVNPEIVRITTQFDDDDGGIDFNDGLKTSEKAGGPVLCVGGSPGTARRVNVSSSFTESTPARAMKHNRIDQLEISVINTGTTLANEKVARMPDSINNRPADVRTQAVSSGSRRHAIELSPVDRHQSDGDRRSNDGRDGQRQSRDVANESFNSTEESDQELRRGNTDESKRPRLRARESADKASSQYLEVPDNFHSRSVDARVRQDDLSRVRASKEYEQRDAGPNRASNTSDRNLEGGRKRSPEESRVRIPDRNISVPSQSDAYDPEAPSADLHDEYEGLRQSHSSGKTTVSDGNNRHHGDEVVSRDARKVSSLSNCEESYRRNNHQQTLNKTDASYVPRRSVDRRHDSCSPYDPHRMTARDVEHTSPSFDAFHGSTDEENHRSFNGRKVYTDGVRGNASEILSSGGRDRIRNAPHAEMSILHMSADDEMDDDGDRPLFSSTFIDVPAKPVMLDSGLTVDAAPCMDRMMNRDNAIKLSSTGKLTDQSENSRSAASGDKSQSTLRRSSSQTISESLLHHTHQTVASLSNESLVEEVWHATNDDHLAAVAAFEQNWYKPTSNPVDIDGTTAAVTSHIASVATFVAEEAEHEQGYPDDCYKSPTGGEFERFTTANTGEEYRNLRMESVKSTEGFKTTTSTFQTITDSLNATSAMSYSVGSSDLSAITSSIAANLLSSSLGMSLYANPTNVHASSSLGDATLSTSSHGNTALLAGGSLSNVNLLASSLTGTHFLSDPMFANLLSGPLASGLLNASPGSQNQPMSFEVAQKLAEELMKLIPTQKQPGEKGFSTSVAGAQGTNLRAHTQKSHRDKSSLKRKEQQKTARRPTKPVSVRPSSVKPAKVVNKVASRTKIDEKLLDPIVDDNTVYDPEDPRSFNFDDLEMLSPPSPSHHDDKLKHDKAAKTASAKAESRLAADTSCAEVKKYVIEEVKNSLMPFFTKRRITKDEYKDVLRKAVPKICQSRTRDFSSRKITIYVEAYIRKVQQMKKYLAKKNEKPPAPLTAEPSTRTLS